MCDGQTSTDKSQLYSNLPVKCHKFILPTDAASRGFNADITNCEYIGSYNWVSNHGDQSIIVPGSPREWQERPLPHYLRLDREGHYRDQYDPRMRSINLLPLLLSVNHWQERTQPSEKYPWYDVDFITNRNSIRNLLRILRNQSSGSYDSRGITKDYSRGNFNNPSYSNPVRIDVELAGNKTILLNRWDSTTFEPITRNSCGFNFENAFTREADAVSALDSVSKDSGRHLRIVSYDFGGLHMVVRSEIDACIPSAPQSSYDFINEIVPSKSEQESSSSQQITTAFGLNIIPSPNPPTPQSHLIELSTVSTSKTTTFQTWNAKERYPQLFFSQVPNHYLACHTKGLITQVRKRDIHTSPEILFYQPTIQPQFKTLRHLLHMIQMEVIKQSRRFPNVNSFSLVYKNGQLSLFERVGERCLPDEAFAMFNV
ncbi:hypothetical protein AGABI2DRAFT_119382 [Agaricus bisporus var. bisporus H97]|uniref:hypothetical protein n=1 Tax=Agaricus bisporus var. bisporus (strain H97 / ATCC MYA-4626 / FGSC 10389) TaxID=936046 RepID=UPI00029F7AD1|nr:hypothetical protein AGABI2DRAFT_119382 [Agaricus bisporus var. bisporus H97]EKV45706.1 hypothetical protein AGABI2DRAFT_119382 [Agaricus bisporus var. bisporus H97]